MKSRWRDRHVERRRRCVARSTRVVEDPPGTASIFDLARARVHGQQRHRAPAPRRQDAVGRVREPSASCAASSRPPASPTCCRSSHDGAATSPNAPSADRQARRFVGPARRRVPDAVADEIAIMVSELATNCVRHTVTDFTVASTRPAADPRRGDRHGGGARTSLARPRASRRGAGLRIVRELSDSFGITELSVGPGKTVWFVVELEERSGARGR